MMPLPSQVVIGSHNNALFHLFFPEGKDINTIERMDSRIPTILNVVLLSVYTNMPSIAGKTKDIFWNMVAIIIPNERTVRATRVKIETKINPRNAAYGNHGSWMIPMLTVD